MMSTRANGSRDRRAGSPRRPWRSACADRGRCAFTLIELLVVIALISLLVSILLPALAGARKVSRAALCMTHLRSQGQAMQLYANDFDGAVVRGEDMYNDNLLGPGMHFAAAMLPGLGYSSASAIGQLYREDTEPQYLRLLGSIPAFQCPDFPNDAQMLDFVVNAFRNPYTGNTEGGQPGGGPNSENVVSDVDNVVFDRLNRVRQTGRIIYVTEGHRDLPTDSVSLSDLFFVTQLPLAAYPRIATDRRHPGGLNALFFDTHVDRLAHNQMDAGWPNLAGQRLLYFTTVRAP